MKTTRYRVFKSNTLSMPFSTKLAISGAVLLQSLPAHYSPTRSGRAAIDSRTTKFYYRREQKVLLEDMERIRLLRRCLTRIIAKSMDHPEAVTSHLI
jgi:hypothetical protein